MLNKLAWVAKIKLEGVLDPPHPRTQASFLVVSMYIINCVSSILPDLTLLRANR